METLRAESLRLAKTAQGPGQSGSVPSLAPRASQGRPKGSQAASSSSYCNLLDTEEVKPGKDAEDEEWDARQQQTGAAGRLVVYDERDRPREDLILRGGGQRRIMVTSVLEGGKASQAGVKAGDVLVSIDGRKDFQGMTADAVHASLRAPVKLVFLGFVGKLQAEVRLNYKQKLLGLSTLQQVAVGRPEAPFVLADEVVFQPSSAALLLATTTPTTMLSQQVDPSATAAAASGGDSPLEDLDLDELGSDGHAFPPTGPAVSQMEAQQPLAAVYELRGPEARNLVSRALSRAMAAAPFVRTDFRGTTIGGESLDQVGEDLRFGPQSSAAAGGTSLEAVIIPELQARRSQQGSGRVRDGKDLCGLFWWMGERCERG